VLARDLGNLGVRSNAIAPVANTRLWGTVSAGYEAPPPGDFDPMRPGQVAPFVTWLASGLAKGITGQVFAVSGNRIQLIRGYHPVTQIDSEDKDWTPDRIEERRDELIGAYDVGLPPFLPPLGWQ
jgi:hypothetical protein